MRIAVASGKGGTGKTTLATNLAHVLAEEGVPAAYLDCDVEEPNGHIFLKPEIDRSRRVSIPVPEVDESKCTYCRACSQACRFSAILVLKNKVLTFPNLCHGCGGCTLACDENAIREVPRPMGAVELGRAGKVTFLQGRMDVGEAMAPPVIREVLKEAPQEGVVIVDAPPGTSCPVIESVKGADVVLLVTEPTPFGLHDLKLAVAMVRTLGIPFGVAVNRVGVGDREVFYYCQAEGIPVLLELPDDRRIAESYSRGELAVEALPELRGLFEGLMGDLRDLAEGPTPDLVVPEPIREEAVPPALPSADLPPGQAASVKELVVISGKGGTGKTSVVASFFALAKDAVVVDCDVDAADLHLVLDPRVEKRWSFSGGSEAEIDAPACDACAICVDHCRFDAIVPAGEAFRVDPVSCEGCGVCMDVCPTGAARLIPSVNGEWFTSDTRYGPMVHARLGIAQENSGKLVSLVRREARALASRNNRHLLISDGSPGIGCPVIASITGAQMVLVVTEPTLSGLHDMERVAQMTRHFGVKTAVCINKVDINLELADRLEQEAGKIDLPVLGRIRYDPAVTRAQVNGKAVVEAGPSPADEDIRALWEQVRDAIG
jgi:MinD superfamily P-loop ATPase